MVKFWEGLGSQLASRWVATALTPAFVFWAGGAAAYLWGHEKLETWTRFDAWLRDAPVSVQAAVLTGALILVAVSAFAAEWLSLPVLRALEGYWPAWLGLLRRGLVMLQRRRQLEWEARLNEVATARDGSDRADPRLEAEYTALDARLHRMPADPVRLMPTRLGNVLRAAESRPLDKYGLDTVVCWSRLWLLLPDAVREDISGARGQMDMAARAWLWGVLFPVWSIWAWWAAPAGLLVVLLAYRRLLDAAAVYGDLLESAFDLHRADLYRALRIPLPTRSDEEVAAGLVVSQYLWRGPVGLPIELSDHEE